MLAGWGYTGGPKPYGYLGLGELFVFVFFGLVATVGTTYVVIEAASRRTPGWPVASAGFLACALLVVNNLRDIPTDQTAGKRTLAVRLGDDRTRWLYVGCIGAAAVLIIVIAVVWRAWAAIALAGLVVADPADPDRSQRGAAARLIPVLAAPLELSWSSACCWPSGWRSGPIST